MNGFASNKTWLHRFALLTAVATLGLVGMGGLVTSHGVGMAVPDWPTSYGYNMFALPISTWFTGGVFHEHTHRLWASFVGVLVVALARWLGGRKTRLPLALIGLTEIGVGQLLLLLGQDWKGAGHFLAGIGSVVLLAGMVWVKNEPAARPLPALGWIAFGLVQLQGLLGGLRVVLDAQVVAEVRLGTFFGVFHAFLAQGFLALLFVIVLLTSRWWIHGRPTVSSSTGPSNEICRFPAGTGVASSPASALILGTTILIFLQLLIAATMRHQHAGLAIPDFPLAYGKWWPDLNAEAVARYNAQRIEVAAANAITSFQVALQMVHRGMAALILVGVAAAAWRTRRQVAVGRLTRLWLGLILGQVALGAWTIWSNKAADIATAHVLVGALSLVTGVLASTISFRRFTGTIEIRAPLPAREPTLARVPA